MDLTNLNSRLVCFAIILFVAQCTSRAQAYSLPNLHKRMSMKTRHTYWMQHYGRVYKNQDEENKRYNIFKKNVERIEKFNANSTASKSFRLSVNGFADLTQEEIKARYTGYKRSNHANKFNLKKLSGSKYANITSHEVPSSVDWRDVGAVTPVRSQGSCGSCWAFGTVAVTESFHYLTTGQLIPLSEQEMVDCSKDNNGCSWGDEDDAMAFITQYGLMKRTDYPYDAQEGSCKMSSTPAVEINGYEVVQPQGSEEALMVAVSYQPVAISIDGSGSDFTSYGGGIFDGECGDNIDHLVAVVGYGTSLDGVRYWIIKNSWGTWWGENGYMRIVMGKNKCGLPAGTAYPV